MRKHYYTKIKNVFRGAEKLHLQAVDNEVYLSEGHMIVRMPDWMYEEQFLQADANIYPGTFVVVQDGERLTVEGFDVKEDGPDLRKWWQDAFDRHCGYAARPEDHKTRYGKWYVRFLETEYDKVMLNNKYYEAMEQAARGGLVYGENRRTPVWFYDMPEIYRSAFCACVLPINYVEVA